MGKQKQNKETEQLSLGSRTYIIIHVGDYRLRRKKCQTKR